MANNLYTTTNAYPQTALIDQTTQRPTPAWQQFFLNLLNFTSATTASGGGSATVPSGPVGFINITVNGQPFKVPYYNP
jgi:hypothetical protein